MRSANCRRCKARVAETGEHIVFDCDDGYRRSLRRRYIAGARTWEDLDKPRRKPKEGAGGQAKKEEDLVETFFANILCSRAAEEEEEEEEEDEAEGELVDGGRGAAGADAEGGADAGVEAETEDEGRKGRHVQGELERARRVFTFLGTLKRL